MPDVPFVLPKAYYQGEECKVVARLRGGKVRIVIVATGVTLVVPSDEVYLS